MQAFLLIDLSEESKFEKPILQLVRQHAPAIPVFDVDAKSDATLQQYAVRLLQENPETVVCVKGGAGDLNRLMPLLEELLLPHPQRHLLLVGQQPRLLRMLQSRPGIAYTFLADEDALRQFLTESV
ncbi:MULTISPECIES: hypothetical protein [Pontibacter]|uniref:Uncharacterized protein n=1 Tax=Pontibacter lucknowensis TaxID=1077936 RepID=A0A1N6U6N3_9BACT|nr:MULTISPECIES: hypothetical protein [Pontibacter]EJF11526.1 hypothetical protein O71_02652 [Pontibacter sp. BAB1700]SIQ61292.1 hypothetical protein SAMN05421545_0713 [Pontibacter lucknowensis]